MKEFSFFSPGTLDEALTLMNQYKGKASVIAGGTDIVLELNDRSHHPDYIVDISKIKELRYVKVVDGIVRIGALSTFTDLENDPYLRDHVKSLYSACYYVGSPQIRNLGTIGGNVVNASVAGDTPTAFISLDATVVLRSAAGKREMKLTDFYGGPGKTELEKDELLTEIYFEAPTEQMATAYTKLGKRKALVIVVIGLAVLLEKDCNNICSKAQVVIGAVARYPQRLPLIEHYLVGKPVTKETFDGCRDLFSQTVYEMIPTRASVGYKKESVKGVASKTFDSILSDFSLCGVEE
ncbi:MAG TPA: xanthine dehydrogenase family protein subunit M [Peptococcaceae bacterium]|nr:xanthine dehydrogenase family protein subunit M [Peptococcaceae bacterium]